MYVYKVKNEVTEVNALMLLITLNHMAVFCQTEHGFVLAGKVYAR